MTKLQLPRLAGGYLDMDRLNEWATLLETALDNTLSRDGATPNALLADLDLNGQNLLNSGADPNDPNAVLTRSAIEQLVQGYASGYLFQRVETTVATAGQTTITLATMSYTTGANNIAVFVDGLRVFDFEEVSPTEYTLAVPLTAGQIVRTVSNDYVATVALPAHRHAWADITGVPVYTTRWPTYTEVTGKPTTFPPSTHTHNASAITTGRLADAQRGVYVQASAPTLGTGDAGALWFW